MNHIDKKITIAIDGYSSCGKSTLAKDLAMELGYIYIDTGAMYRAVALYAFRKGWISTSHLDKEEIIAHLNDLQIEFRPTATVPHLYLNGENVENEIRSMQISQLVSHIATIKEVRAKLVDEQRKMGQQGGVVLDGRDIGSVVFPNAELKLFLTADKQTRALRRWNELKEKTPNISVEEVLENLLERDQIDTSRKESPLIQTDDAILLDNTKINMEEQLLWVLNKIRENLKQ